MTRTLTRTGTEILLVYGAKLFPAKAGRPGMRCIVDGDGVVLVQAIGYGCATARGAAIQMAAATCLDAGLLVRPIGHTAAFLTYKKGTVC